MLAFNKKKDKENNQNKKGNDIKESRCYFCTSAGTLYIF